MNRVIFVDIDGPMIPVRAYYLPNQTPLVSIFDPCAVALLLRLVEHSKAKLVISSTWGIHGYEKCMAVFEKNGVSRDLFHPDWVTPRKMSSSRSQEINLWLARHPEVTAYVAIDDEDLDIELVERAVKCDAHEGFSWRNYLECCVHLYSYFSEYGTKEKMLYQIEYFKRAEIWRTKRSSEPGAHLARNAADLVFPQTSLNEEDL